MRNNTFLISPWDLRTLMKQIITFSQNVMKTNRLLWLNTLMYLINILSFLFLWYRWSQLTVQWFFSWTRRLLFQGKCFIKGKILNLLYDLCTNHSFISDDCVKHLELPISFLDASLIVLTPTSEFVTTNPVCVNCPLLIENKKFLVDLICPPML